jgi:GTP cyclohydrolase I
MAAAYEELLTPRPFRPTTFPNEEGYDELVLIRSMPFHSLCMHHLLPFHGLAHIGYLPGDRMLGLSKFARVVELFARDLQVQERLTEQIADWLQEQLAPKGVGVVLEAEQPVHVAARGAEVRRQDRHVCPARTGPRRPPHPPGVPGSDNEERPIAQAEPLVIVGASLAAAKAGRDAARGGLGRPGGPGGRRAGTAVRCASAHGRHRREAGGCVAE